MIGSHYFIFLVILLVVILFFTMDVRNIGFDSIKVGNKAPIDKVFSPNQFDMIQRNLSKQTTMVLEPYEDPVFTKLYESLNYVK